MGLKALVSTTLGVVDTFSQQWNQIQDVEWSQNFLPMNLCAKYHWNWDPCLPSPASSFCFFLLLFFFFFLFFLMFKLNKLAKIHIATSRRVVKFGCLFNLSLSMFRLGKFQHLLIKSFYHCQFCFIILNFIYCSPRP